MMTAEEMAIESHHRHMEKLLAESEKLREEREKFREEGIKLRAEQRKLEREWRWYPVYAAVAFVGAVTALATVLNRIFG